MSNRRPSRISRGLQGVLARLWLLRRVLLLAIPYLLLLGWLFSGAQDQDFRTGEVFGVPASPAWSGPDGKHWFGTTAGGKDLFELTRCGLAHSVSVAVVSASFGIGLAFLLTSLFLFDRSEGRFAVLERLARAGAVLPAMAGLVVFAGGAGGGKGVVLSGLALAAAFHLAPLLARWFREGEDGFDTEAAYIAGLSRLEVVRGRILPKVLRRLPGLFASLVPILALAEIALSFLGFAGETPSPGAIIAHGRDYIIEAPWLSIHPGILTTAVIAALSLLGWRVSSALGSDEPPRFL